MQLSKKKVDKLVDEFNEKFPVGNKVLWRSVSVDPATHRERVVKHKALNLNGQAVCWLEGISGCVSIEPQFLDYAGSEELNAE